MIIFGISSETLKIDVRSHSRDSHARGALANGESHETLAAIVDHHGRRLEWVTDEF